MKRTLQITTATAAFSLGLCLAAPPPAVAQWFGNMGQRMRDAQDQQNQAIQRMRNLDRPQFRTPGTMRGALADGVDDFYVDPMQEDAGGQGAGGQGDGGQGGGGQRNDHPDHHHHHYGFWLGTARPLLSTRPLYVRSPDPVVPAGPPPNFIPQPSPTVPDNAVLINPRQNGGPISYTLNAIRYTMQPGYEQKLPAGRSWTIEFDRGGSFGTARYSLRPGTYAFAVTDRGWDVVRRTNPLTTDSTPPPAPVVAQAAP